MRRHAQKRAEAQRFRAAVAAALPPTAAERRIGVQHGGEEKSVEWDQITGN
jgi:hypothetical protein